MDFNEFGNDLEESANFLRDKLLVLHPWDKEWNLNLCSKLVPFYKEKFDLLRESNPQVDADDFDRIIRLSSILDTNQVKLVFMEQFESLPLILDGKYLNAEERIDLLMKTVNDRLKRVDKGLYLFFNHEEDF